MHTSFQHKTADFMINLKFVGGDPPPKKKKPVWVKKKKKFLNEFFVQIVNSKMFYIWDPQKYVYDFYH